MSHFIKQNDEELFYSGSAHTHQSTGDNTAALT